MVKLTLICALMIVNLFGECESYRILGIFPIPSTSHFVIFQRLMKGLAEKGHEVDVISHFPQSKPSPRYNDLSVRGTMPIFNNNISIEFINDRFENRFGLIDFIIVYGGLEPCQAILNSNVMQEIKHTTKKYDIVITEIFGCDCMLGFGHYFNIPVVSITTSTNLPWGSDRFGNPDNPSYIPVYILPYLTKMNLWERLDNTLTLLYAKIAYYYSGYAANEVAKSFFGPDLPDLIDLAYKTNLFLVNSHFSTNFARPTVPNFVEIGGLHIEPTKPLPKHLEEAINITSTKYKGVIYMSFGSMVLTETLPLDKLRAFFEAFRELPYKVLWKATKEKMPKDMDIPSNIHFEPWMPQADILCHPNVKMFVSHGGLMGTQEAIHCGVPRLGIPLFADQELNLKASENMGLAIRVNYNNITKESILKTAKMLLDNPKYQETATTVSKRFKDRPLPALETAIYWIEYVIRHDGAPHLRSYGAELPWYQYYLLDIGAILSVALVIFLSLVYYMTLFLLKLLVCSKVKSKKD